ncbi:S8 family serine peptidase [Roseivirga sp. BDSF3-8]|uniref:S8 family peptidase n=1 Tax=Roseivirga sp. BDSF3-8 TaxID=3241598 RepID=UPI003531E208
MKQEQLAQRYNSSNDSGGSKISERPHWGVEQELLDLHKEEIKVNGVKTRMDGSGVKIAILDGAVDLEHSSFRQNQHKSFDLITDNWVKYPDKTVSHKHGTMVAGVIGADGCGKPGRLHGVAPGAAMYCYRVMDSSQRIVPYALEKSLVCAFEEGVDIINMSIRHLPADRRILNLIREAFRRGIVLVAQAGNYEYNGVDNVDYPAALQETLAIAGHDRGTYAARKAKGQFLDFTAPGSNLCGLAPGQQYTNDTGSSFACSYFSGLVALLLQVYHAKNLYPSPSQVEAIMAGCTYSNAFSIESGHGCISVKKLISHLKSL